MSETEMVPVQAPPISKATLLKDALVFQIKLVIDGIRDFVLIPVSIGATLMSLLKPGDKAGHEFYEVVAFGRETEKNINLFGVADRIGQPTENIDLPDIDTLVGQVEGYVTNEMTSERAAKVRGSIEALLERLNKRHDRTADG